MGERGGRVGEEWEGRATGVGVRRRRLPGRHVAVRRCRGGRPPPGATVGSGWEGRPGEGGRAREGEMGWREPKGWWEVV